MVAVESAELAAVPSDLAFNTAASFTTNTNWQAYVPEVTMSYFTQMAGLAYHNFISAAVGIALAIAVIRGVARREQDTIGNFWVDLTRTILWVLLPACLVVSLMFVSQGVIQNLKPYTTTQLVDAQTVQFTGADGKTTTQVVKEQKIPQGPVASQEAIKIFGTNGGGFFNANSAHPYENPTPLTQFSAADFDFRDSFWADVHVGTDDGVAEARLGGVGRDGRAVSGGGDFGVCGGGAGKSAAAWRGPESERATVWRKHGRQGSTVWHRGYGAVCNGDDGCELRRGERDARFVHAAGRNDSAGQHYVRRGGVWRSGLRALRNDRVRDSFGVHSGTDGGQNAGISGQEDRSVRREDGDAFGADFPAA